MKILRWLMIALSCLCQPALPQAESPAKSYAVESVLKVLGDLWDYHRNRQRRRGQEIGFEIPELVVNQYLAYSFKTKPRPGIKSAKVRLLPANELDLSLVLDLDAVKGWDPAAVPKKLGKVPLDNALFQVKCGFQIADNRLTYKIHSAVAGDEPISNAAFQRIAETVAARQPEQFDLTKPLPIPLGLRRLWTADKVLGGSTQ
jgi:hypothetical protein